MMGKAPEEYSVSRARAGTRGMEACRAGDVASLYLASVNIDNLLNELRAGVTDMWMREVTVYRRRDASEYWSLHGND